MRRCHVIVNARHALRHRLILRAVAPDAELPDVDWQSPRPPDEYRQFVRTENRRLCDRLQQFLQPSPVLAPQTCEPALS